LKLATAAELAETGLLISKMICCQRGNFAGSGVRHAVRIVGADGEDLCHAVSEGLDHATLLRVAALSGVYPAAEPIASRPNRSGRSEQTLGHFCLSRHARKTTIRGLKQTDLVVNMTKN
jgi:hypothetical protein